MTDEQRQKKDASTQLNKPRPDWFARFAAHASSICGSRWAFVAAIGVIVVWAALGPGNHYSDTWQLVINTGTTIVTFLMVFLIQNTQNRDSRAINLKLNEVIRAIGGADDAVIDIEKLSDEQLDELTAQYERIRAKCVEERRRRSKRAGVDEAGLEAKIAGHLKSDLKGEVKSELRDEISNEFERVFEKYHGRAENADQRRDREKVHEAATGERDQQDSAA